MSIGALITFATAMFAILNSVGAVAMFTGMVFRGRQSLDAVQSDFGKCPTANRAFAAAVATPWPVLVVRT